MSLAPLTWPSAIVLVVLIISAAFCVWCVCKYLL
jgi:hypothetical protein